MYRKKNFNKVSKSITEEIRNVYFKNNLRLKSERTVQNVSINSEQ